MILPAWAGSSDPAPGPWGEWGAPMAAELTVQCLQLTSVWWQPPRGAPGPAPTLVKKVTQSPQSSSGSERVVVDLTHPDWFIWPQCVSTEIWGSPSSHCTALKGRNTQGLHGFPRILVVPWPQEAGAPQVHLDTVNKGLSRDCFVGVVKFCLVLTFTTGFNCIPFMIFFQTKAQ